MCFKNEETCMDIKTRKAYMQDWDGTSATKLNYNTSIQQPLV